MKFYPSLSLGGKSPLLGITENSGSESEVKCAVKGAECLSLFDNLKEILDVLFNGEYITILSSSSGSVASNYNLNL